MCHLSYPQLLSCAYSYKYLEVLWLPKRTKLWACFNTEPNRLYRRLRLFPSKLQEYTPPPFSRLSTQYHIDPLLTCFLSFDTSRTSLRLQQSTKFGNRHSVHGRYEYSYHLANSRENWAQKKKNRPRVPGGPWGRKRHGHYIYTLAQIRPLHCTISSLALRRSATNILAATVYANAFPCICMVPPFFSLFKHLHLQLEIQ